MMIMMKMMLLCVRLCMMNSRRYAMMMQTRMNTCAVMIVMMRCRRGALMMTMMMHRVHLGAEESAGEYVVHAHVVGGDHETLRGQ